MPLLAGVVTLWVFVNARRRAAIVSVDVPIPGLPQALHGFTIAQISDIHVGPTIKGPYLQPSRCRERHARHMVAVTGDLVEAVFVSWPTVAPWRAQLTARHLLRDGNHEYYSGAHA